MGLASDTPDLCRTRARAGLRVFRGFDSFCNQVQTQGVRELSRHNTGPTQGVRASQFTRTDQPDLRRHGDVAVPAVAS
jgi:hypothetical protein